MGGAFDPTQPVTTVNVPTVNSSFTTQPPSFTTQPVTTASIPTASAIPTLSPDPSNALSAPTLNTSPTTGTSSDTRVRLRAMRGQETQIYGPAGQTTAPDGSNSPSSNILNILNSTDGLLFPYTPSISVSQDVDYRDVGPLVHSIGDILAYTHTPSTKISISADFTVQNQREGQYALAVIHFLRTVSKMYFGQIDKTAGKAGIPPPILIFTGYGNYVFDNLPVIVKNHSYSFDKAMNMISIAVPGGIATLPAMFQISIELQVQQTPNAMRTVFSLDSFRTGALLTASAEPGWI